MRSTDILVEVLGCPSDEMYEPVNAGYVCPYIGSTCTKRGHNTKDPFPVCSIWKHSGSGVNRKKERPVVLCPKRFYQATLIDDILEHCWIGDYDREKINSVMEIKMGKIGNVDMVVCDTSTFPTIDNFISVELQAVDITGSVSNAYNAHLHKNDFDRKDVKYGFNTANVFKRYLTQLIKKGYFHSTWRKKIVAVVQDFLLEDIRKRVRFSPTNPKDPNTSIVFMSYTLDVNEKTEEGFYNLKFKEAIGTEHSALMSAVVYEEAPDPEQFKAAIVRQLT
ncbi:NotI family restriction endonuclease [Kroppenstedtia eburnea]|uniref:NotI family restriction endonuclease n=1 Tax=Kroppenstedtia eburnea TaxID=714067 RepID=UPI00363A2257